MDGVETGRFGDSEEDDMEVADGSVPECSLEGFRYGCEPDVAHPNSSSEWMRSVQRHPSATSLMRSNCALPPSKCPAWMQSLGSDDTVGDSAEVWPLFHCLHLPDGHRAGAVLVFK